MGRASGNILTGLPFALFCALVLTGCATGLRIESSVQSFTKLTAIQPSTTIAVFGGEKTGSLEFQSVESSIRPHLEAAGYRVVSMQDDPDQVLVVSYARDGGRTVQSTALLPLFGQTGVASRTTTGSITTQGNLSTFNATTTNSPSFGMTGVVPVTTAGTVYGRVLVLDIIDIRKSTPDRLEPVHQIHVVSEGSCPNIHAVLDGMIIAAFKNFPGPPAHSSKFSVPMKGNC